MLRKITLTSIVIFSILMNQQSNAEDASSDPTQIIHEIQRLVDLRELKTEAFTKALQSKNSKVVETALIGLGRIGGENAIPLLTPFINHKSTSFRRITAFSLGLSKSKLAVPLLKQQLVIEKDDTVKHEIYIGLGNIAPDGLITEMMEQLENEKSANAKASLFQGLGIALVFNSKLKDDFDDLDFDDLLDWFKAGDDNAARIGFFMDRIPDIGKQIDAKDLVRITNEKLTPLAAVYLTRLISKVTKEDSSKNRELLAWLISQSETKTLNEQLEAIRGMQNMMDFPQSLVQLGKLQASSIPIVAQTALNVLANSDNNSRNIVSLLKRQLQNANESMVVEAMTGLIKRQKKDQLSWAMKIIKHPSPYVRIQLIKLLKARSKTEFNNVIQFLTQDPNANVSQYAQSMLADKRPEPQSTKAVSPDYQTVLTAVGKRIEFKTSQGNFIVALLPESPYTAWHFLNNANQGNFNNTYFQRVIGNFVAQGGDSVGDGSGSTNRTIREEINFLPHQPMTVAMATSGKDTGTSQFYINTARNLHLDRNYTIFGQVISGENIVWNMTHGAIVFEAKEVK